MRYPGLAAHPDHRRAAELFDGFGPVLSFRPFGGAAAAEVLLKSLRLPYAASSLGGVESLVTRLAEGGHPGSASGSRAARTTSSASRPASKPPKT